MGNAHHGKEKDINALKEENKRLQQQLVQLQSQKQQETTKSPVNKKRKREENEDDDEHERKSVRLSQIITVDKDAKQNTLQNFVVVFTGFKHDNIKYTKTLKNKLVSKLKKLNITVPPESKEREVLDNNITHIVSTPTARTMKVLQGVLNGKWIMSTKWVDHLASNPTSRDFESYGFRKEDNPINHKTIFLSKSFVSKFEGETTMVYVFSHFLIVVGIKFGNATRVDTVKDADFCIIGSLSKSPRRNEVLPAKSSEHDERAVIAQEHPSVFICNWTEFIDLLFPPYYETFLRKIESEDE